jgi:hypothetical protein
MGGGVFVVAFLFIMLMVAVSNRDRATQPRVVRAPQLVQLAEVRQVVLPEGLAADKANAAAKDKVQQQPEAARGEPAAPVNLPGNEAPAAEAKAVPGRPGWIEPADKLPPGRETFGTAVGFARNPLEAARIAGEEHKLTFLLHVSGNFEEERFT